MLEVYTIYGGDMWRQAFNAVVTILGTSTWATLLRMVGTFSVLAVVISFVKSRNPLVFIHWLAIFMLVTSVLLVPKRSVQIIDITDRAAVYKVDNVPVGLAGISSLTSSIGFHLAELYDYIISRPDSVTYTKSGMLFGSQIVAETSDFRTQNPELAQMLPDYVENCVIGDILLNHKYTVNQLLNSSDPLTLITDNPSPLRGIYKTSTSTRQFITCMEAATEIRQLANTDSQVGGRTFQWLSGKIFGNRIDATSLLMQSMGESYGYFYSGGLSASQIMKNNITNGAIRQGIKGFAARSSDTANLVNLATESSATKQRLSWAAGNALATRTLPFMQSLLMLILVCIFPLVIALAAANHALFGLTTLKHYVSGFLYFQMWPIMFAILNFASTFWLQTKTGSTPLVLANMDQVALQHSDVANLAGYLALSIPVLSFYLTKGAATVGSQVAGNVFSSMAFSSAGQSSTTADGNWSFNNMSMDNLNQNKMDTNLVQRQGQQTFQADNGSTRTVTAGGMNVIDSSGAISNLPVSMKLSQLASSGFQEQARISEAKATSALDGYNHSVTSGWSQLSQISKQVGSSDTLSQGSDNSQSVNASRGASMMMSAAENYAKANNISTQEAYNQLMHKSQEGTFNAGGSVKFNTGDQAFGKIGKLASGISGEVHTGAEYRGSDGSSHGTQESNTSSQDSRHDKSSQAVNDFRQGMDMVASSRISDSANHTDNSSTSDVQQFAATLNDAKNQYHQYTESSTRSDEFSKMSTLAQNQSASLDTNYNQEFVNWASEKYGDKAPEILTSAPSAREAAVGFVEEKLKPQIMSDSLQGRRDLKTGESHEVFDSQSQTSLGRPPSLTSSVSLTENNTRTSISGAEGNSQVHSQTNSNMGPQYETYTGDQTGYSNVANSNSISSNQSNIQTQNQIGLSSGPKPEEHSVQNNTEGFSGQSTVENLGSASTRSREAQQNINVQSQTASDDGERTVPVSVRNQSEGSTTHSSERNSNVIGERLSSGEETGLSSKATSHGVTRSETGDHQVELNSSNGMSEEFNRNQEIIKLKAGMPSSSQGGGGSSGDDDIAKRVAEHRSSIQENMKDSSDKIAEKLSTVRASSDIIKGEHDNAVGSFSTGLSAERRAQGKGESTSEPEDIKKRLQELRNKTSE
ncbi:conjugal transfer mating-pair stabilization protein TraG [Pectobacterium versatile]|uniref:conjugal transfer mating-pair stabilization protein TraG n=1 Tax=Pectobacterium versatile TaxID=2488639 RepID=UPI002B2451D3|nr:conjugal transfer mating-pair stabilization protein TraG [Pectobacterium versatile]